MDKPIFYTITLDLKINKTGDQPTRQSNCIFKHRSLYYSAFKLSLVSCRSVKASHVLISADGQVCMSGLRSIFSLIRHGQRARVVHDFPQYSVKVLPWLSPEVLQQVLCCFPLQSCHIILFAPFLQVLKVPVQG